MKKFYLFFCFFLCSFFSLTFFAAAQAPTAGTWVTGDWIGYISIDNKPMYRLQISSTENADKTITVETYYYPFTKRGDAFRYDTTTMALNEKDTTGTFDLAIPGINSGKDCKWKIIIRRSNLYTLHILAKYQPYQPCQQTAALYLNDWAAMSENPVYKNAPDIDPKTGQLIPNDTKEVTQQDTPVKNQPAGPYVPADHKKISAESAESFNGKWGGYITVKDKPAYVIFFNFKSYEKKTIAANCSIYRYGGDSSALIEKKQLVFEYDKQKNIAYVNSEWPTPQGGHCTGYLIIDMDKKDEANVSAKFQLNKSCMDATVTLNKEMYISNDPIFTAHFSALANAKLKLAMANESIDKLNPSGLVTLFTDDSKKNQADIVNTSKGNVLVKNKTTSKSAPVLAKRPGNAPLAGGATVEQLGMQVVKALKTNDRKLWMACIHPDVGYAAPYNDPGILDNYAKSFDRMHEYFETHGVSHFDKLTYSITSFDYAGPDKVINMQIEFYYQGKEFLCGVQYGSAKKYKGRFYFESVPNEFAFVRNVAGK